MSFLAVDYQRTAVVCFGVLRPCLEPMSGPVVVGYLHVSMQKLALWFRDQHRKHLPVECRLSKLSVETYGAGGTPDNCPAPPDLLCLYDPDWPELPPPVVSAGSDMHGW
jgi:hypothetical protein